MGQILQFLCAPDGLGEVPMQLGFEEHDAVEEFVDDLVFVVFKGGIGRLQLRLGLPVDGCLGAGDVAGVLLR